MTLPSANWRECERRSWAPLSDQAAALRMAKENLRVAMAGVEAAYMQLQLGLALLEMPGGGDGPEAKTD